jgi:Rieske Fe-S protein
MAFELSCSASCPLLAGRMPEPDVPVGQLFSTGRKIPPPLFAAPAGTPPDEGTSFNPEVDETKRNLIKLLAIGGVAAAAGGGLAGGALQYVKQPIVGLTSYPKVQIIDVDGAPLTATKAMAEYNVYSPGDLIFYYPLTNEPNFFLNLQPASGKPGGATNVPGGVGPKGSIVAYSAICQHLGCPAPAISYYPPGTCPQNPGGHSYFIHCSCHGSTYDVENSAANITGPAIYPLPQVTLEWDSKTDLIYAVGETGQPVKGHIDTLQGGYGVPSSVSMSKLTPIILCKFP